MLNTITTHWTRKELKKWLEVRISNKRKQGGEKWRKPPICGQEGKGS
jgi:hypothetical protein